MRMISSLAVVYLTALIMTAPVIGQTRISQAEFEKSLNEALAASEKYVRRVTVVEETKIADKLIGTNRTVEDFLPPDRQRYVDVISSGGKSIKREIIETGSVGYSKEDDGPWIEWRGSPWRPRSPKYLPPKLELDEERMFDISDEILNGQSVRAIVREGSRDSNGILIRDRFTIWIAQDGLIYKSEALCIEEISDKRVQRTEALWDYAPKGITIKPRSSDY